MNVWRLTAIITISLFTITEGGHNAKGVSSSGFCGVCRSYFLAMHMGKGTTTGDVAKSVLLHDDCQPWVICIFCAKCLDNLKPSLIAGVAFHLCWIFCI